MYAKAVSKEIGKAKAHLVFLAGMLDLLHACQEAGLKVAIASRAGCKEVRAPCSLYNTAEWR